MSDKPIDYHAWGRPDDRVGKCDYPRAAVIDAYERGRRDGALEMRARCAKVALDYENHFDGDRIAQAIAALPVPGQPEKESERWYASSPRFFRPEEGSET